MFSALHEQENVGQVVGSTRHLAAGPRTAPVGKTFQAAGEKAGQAVQRKALGIINRELGKTNSNAQPGNGKAQQPSLKPLLKPKQHTFSVTEGIPATVKEESNEADLPPIEFMPTWDKGDTYDDIWDPKFAPATYTEEFRSWRPACLLPSHNDSDSDGSDVSFVDVNLSRDDDFELPNPEFESLELLSPEDLGLNLPSPHELFSDFRTDDL